MNASNSPQVPVERPSRRTLVIVLVVASILAFFFTCLIVGAYLVVSAGQHFQLWALGLANRSPEHQCTMAILQKSPQARSLLGTPIVQNGLARGSFLTDHSDYRVEMSFDVDGPRESGTTFAHMHRAPGVSSMQVVLKTRNGRSIQVYDGPFKCSGAGH